MKISFFVGTCIRISFNFREFVFLLCLSSWRNFEERKERRKENDRKERKGVMREREREKERKKKREGERGEREEANARETESILFQGNSGSKRQSRRTLRQHVGYEKESACEREGEGEKKWKRERKR